MTEHSVRMRFGSSNLHKSEQVGVGRASIAAHPLEFIGTGGEFFKVWIVNVLLTIVTLGFYTPIARKRTAEYFYSRSDIAGSPLEFVAQTRKMFVGFLLLVVLYILYQLAGQHGADALVIAMTLIGGLATPYLWASSKRFRMSATRWRGIRLQFRASWKEVYAASWPLFLATLIWAAAFGVLAMLIPDTHTPAQAQELHARKPGIDWDNGDMVRFFVVLGVALLTSAWCFARLEFNYAALLVQRAFIGNQPGRWKPQFKDFLRIWVRTAGVFLLTILIIGAAYLFFGVAIAGADARTPGGLGVFAVVFFILAFFAGLVIAMLATIPARAYRTAALFKLTFSNIGVSTLARFRCDLNIAGFVWLRIRNVLLTFLTLGLYRPFAMVNEYAYKMNAVTLHIKGGVDQLAGQLATEEGSFADAIADAAGFDIVN